MPFLIVREGAEKDGAAIARTDCPKGEKSHEWPDEALAESRCAQANKDAAELGIKTRYEVVAA